MWAVEVSLRFVKRTFDVIWAAGAEIPRTVSKIQEIKWIFMNNLLKSNMLTLTCCIAKKKLLTLLLHFGGIENDDY